MTSPTAQHLNVLSTVYVVEHQPQATLPQNDDWIALVRAPDGGLTVIREARPADSDERWIGFYSGATAHGLDVPGMLAAMVQPLAQAAISVFVASTFHADLVLVPEHSKHQAVTVLREAGHQVSGE
ncbi:ACT domain-containing protein [Nonomuraea sp. NN258]|nr:ACT domain-containing protein [Nonomuraea antri]